MEISDELWNRLDAGRHALDEDAVLTPIFSALTRSDWHRRQRAAAAAEQFRRDPLTAPLPVVPRVPALAGAGRSGGGAGRGRHHRRVA